jgi:hypothetical protein
MRHKKTTGDNSQRIKAIPNILATELIAVLQVEEDTRMVTCLI